MSLLELAARCEAAAGPDREIDANIAAALGLPPADFERQEQPWLWVKYLGGSTPDFDSWEAPHYTASLDAVVVLIGEKLPRWRGDVDVAGSFPPGEQGIFGARLFSPSSSSPIPGEASSPALALLSATLKALAAKDKTDE